MSNGPKKPQQRVMTTVPVAADLDIGEIVIDETTGIQYTKNTSSAVIKISSAQLTDLSDVNTATATNRNVLIADGTDFESRALVEADISDLTAHTLQLTDLTDVNSAAITNRNVLIADGTDFESRPLVEADISDLTAHTLQLTDLSDVNSAAITNRNVLVADGVDFESRALVEADISDLAVPANQFEFTFSTTITDSDPGFGTMRFNNATIGSITALYIDDAALSGVSIIEVFLWSPQLGGIDRIHVWQNNDPTKYFVGFIASNAENTGYIGITVTAEDWGTLPDNGALVTCSLIHTNANNLLSTGGTVTGPIVMQDELLTGPDFKNWGETVNIIGSIGGGTQDIDLALGNVVSATVDTSTTTFTFTITKATGFATGFTLVLKDGGEFTVNWPASVDWGLGLAPSLTENVGYDVLSFITIDGGTIWYGFTGGLNFS